MQPFDQPPPEFLTVGQSAHGTFVAANSSPAVLLSFHPDEPRGPGGMWIKVDGYSALLDHMAAPPEEGGHGLSRDAVGQVGYTSRFLMRLHDMQHGAGAARYPSHGHHPGDVNAEVKMATPEDRTSIARQRDRERRINQGLMRAPGGLSNVRPAIQLSARTPFLARTPAPRGRPGGPGLYRVQGMGHTPYLQQVVKALIEKRGMRPDKAYAIARAAIRKWSVRSRHPEVKGAATAAEAGELARQARAKMSHSNDWTVADCLVELACDHPAATVIDLFNPYHSPTGQFTTASGAGQGKGKQQAAQRADRKGDKAQRAHLVRQIASLHQQIASLRAQLPQHGRSRSSTPAKRGAGAQSAKQAAQAKASAQQAGKAGAPAKTRKPGMSTATIHAKIAALRAELAADIAQLRSIK